MEMMHAISRLQSHMECPVCLESLSSPKLLFCGHRFCKSCLEQLERHREICCPLCKRTTTKRTNQLPNDVLIESIKDDVERISAVVTYKHCTACRDVEATVRCLDCQTSLCEACHERHNEIHGKGNQHTVVMHDPSVICEQHEKDMAYMCKDCHKLVCSCCLVQECYGHKSIPVGDALKNYLEMRDRTLQDTDLIRDNAVGKKKSLINIFEKTLSDIQEHSERTIAKIQNETRLLIDSINRLKSEALEIVDVTKTASDRLWDFTELRAADCLYKIPLDLFHSLPAILRPEVQESNEIYEIKNAYFQPNDDITVGRVYLDLSSYSETYDGPHIYGCQVINAKKFSCQEFKKIGFDFKNITCALDTEGRSKHRTTIRELFSGDTSRRSLLSSVFWSMAEHWDVMAMRCSLYISLPSYESHKVPNHLVPNRSTVYSTVHSG